jgi:hypothetical protein
MIHLRLAGAIATLGLLFTSRPWLQWLHTLSPEAGLFIKHSVILLIIYILARIDPSIKFVHQSQALGALLVYVSFVMIFNYQSDWVQDAKSENVGDQTLDGVVYHRARNVLKLEPEPARILTFVVVPFLLVLAGSRLVRNGQKLNID